MSKNITRWISGALFIVLGLLTAIGPQTVFKPCSVQLQIAAEGTQEGMHTASAPRFVPMKCHWSAAAQIGIGASIAFLGILLLLFANAAVRLGLSIAQVVLGITAVLMPSKIIGVCMSPAMQCRILMLPMLLVLGCIVIAVSLANSFLLFKKSGRQ